MKRTVLVVLVSAGILASMPGCLKSGSSSGGTGNCVPNNSGVPTTDEINALKNYLSANSITATQDARGFFYIINNPGSGASPGPNSTITVSYVGKLTSGAVFDQNLNGTVFQMPTLIQGWQMGLPLIQKGGSIKLLLPPSLGYGCSQIGIISPGSILIYDVNLIDVQ